MNIDTNPINQVLNMSNTNSNQGIGGGLVPVNFGPLRFVQGNNIVFESPTSIRLAKAGLYRVFVSSIIFARTSPTVFRMQAEDIQFGIIPGTTLIKPLAPVNTDFTFTYDFFIPTTQNNINFTIFGLSNIGDTTIRTSSLTIIKVS